jgi:hypothetical protein
MRGSFCSTYLPSKSSAGGQLLHPCDVNSSITANPCDEEDCNVAALVTVDDVVNIKIINTIINAAIKNKKRFISFFRKLRELIQLRIT